MRSHRDGLRYYYRRHLEEHREHSMREAILVAAQEIGRPLFFAILIIIAVFLPVFTLQGIEGKLFKPLAYAVTFSMFGSILMAATIPLYSVAYLSIGATLPFGMGIEKRDAIIEYSLLGVTNADAWLPETLGTGP